MMTVASLLEDGIELSFADGAKGSHSLLRSSRDRGACDPVHAGVAQPVRDGSEDGPRRDGRDTLGLRPSLL